MNIFDLTEQKILVIGGGIRPDKNLAHYAGQPKDIAQMILAVMTNPALTNAVIDVDGGERLGTWFEDKE